MSSATEQLKRAKRTHAYDGTPTTEVVDEHSDGNRGLVWAVATACCAVFVLAIVGTVFAVVFRPSRPKDNYPPKACFDWRLEWDDRTLSVDASCSRDPDAGDVLTYNWDWGNGAKSEGLSSPFANYTYPRPLPYKVELCVTDKVGHEDCTKRTFDAAELARTTDLNTNPRHCGELYNSCAEDYICCGGQCIPGSADPLNCGACGNVCTQEEECVGKRCLNFQTDNENCGTVGNVCPGSSQCCEAECTNVDVDRDNCGQCGNECVDTGVCHQSQCINLYSDPANCGAIGTECPAGEPACCQAECANTRNNTFHCGACGQACSSDEPCLNGKCIDLDFDDDHCGALNTACGQGQSCCFASCLPTQQDPLNCGGCGIQCAPGQPCLDSRCINFATDPEHCGGLYQRCDPHEVCFNFLCIPAPVCGDGIIQAGEECDDGNTVNGDGCSEYCKREECTQSKTFSIYFNSDAVVVPGQTIPNLLYVTDIFMCGGGGGGAGGGHVVADGSRFARPFGGYGLAGENRHFQFDNVSLQTPMVISVGNPGAAGIGGSTANTTVVPERLATAGGTGGNTQASFNFITFTATGGDGGEPGTFTFCDNVPAPSSPPQGLYCPAAYYWPSDEPKFRGSFYTRGEDAFFGWTNTYGGYRCSIQNGAQNYCNQFVPDPRDSGFCAGGDGGNVGADVVFPRILEKNVFFTQNGTPGGSGRMLMIYEGCVRYETPAP